MFYLFHVSNIQNDDILTESIYTTILTIIICQNLVGMFNNFLHGNKILYSLIIQKNCNIISKIL